MEEETVVSVHLCHKFTSILGEAEDDGSTPPQMLSVFRSIQRRIDDAVSSIPHDLLYDVIDAVSECRIFAGQKGASSAKPLFGLTRFFFTRKMMRRLVAIETRLQELSSHHSQPPRPRKSMIKEITRSHPTSTIIGLELEAQEMEHWLMSYSGASTSAGRKEAAAGKEAFMGIGIVGIRCGCGKTSLAHKVFSSPTVESVFSPRIWVCLSNMVVEDDDDEMDPRTRVVIDILKEVGQEVSELRDGDYSIVKLLEKLHHKLMGKRYLIVLDDAWEVDVWLGDLGYSLPRGYPMGEFLSHGLPKGSPGGAVIVTSRWESVAKRMIGNDKYLIRLPNKLSDEVCWKIFRLHLDAEAEVKAEPLKQDVISICDGLPLAAKILAHALLSKNKKPSAVDHFAHDIADEVGHLFGYMFD